MTNYILPITILIIVCHGLYKKVNLYDEFIIGAKEAYSYALNMFPNILGMIFSVNILVKSNFINNFLSLLKPVFTFIHIPSEIIPLAIMRPISASSSLALLNEIYSTYGVDSFIGKLSSVIQSSTDTTIYIIMLYFGSIGIKKIKHSMVVGLLSDLCSIIISIIVVKLLFS